MTVVAILGEFIDTDPMISSPIYFAKKIGNNASPNTCYLRCNSNNCIRQWYKHQLCQILGRLSTVSIPQVAFDWVEIF